MTFPDISTVAPKQKTRVIVLATWFYRQQMCIQTYFNTSNANSCVNSISMHRRQMFANSAVWIQSIVWHSLPVFTVKWLNALLRGQVLTAIWINGSNTFR